MAEIGLWVPVDHKLPLNVMNPQYRAEVIYIIDFLSGRDKGPSPLVK
jgi:hypothetical protein